MAGREVYKLGEHRLRVLVVDAQAGTRRRQYITVPILTRCLKKTGNLLSLELADKNDLEIIRRIKTRPRKPATEDPQEGEDQPTQGEVEGEVREVIFYRIGSWRAETIRLVYKKEKEEEPGEGEENNTPEEGEGGEGEGEGEGEEKKYKLATLHIPIPNWAPNYKVLPVLFSKARSAELKVVGAYRNGYLIPAPVQRS